MLKMLADSTDWVGASVGAKRTIRKGTSIFACAAAWGTAAWVM